MSLVFTDIDLTDLEAVWLRESNRNGGNNWPCVLDRVLCVNVIVYSIKD